MATLGNVQAKISCVFETQVVEEKSHKRSGQPYRVVACDKVRHTAVESGLQNAWPSEKLDGTCVYVADFQGQPWLWARLDRKPNKQADRKFKKFQTQKREWEVNGKTGREPIFQWDMKSDFKTVPGYWVAADGVPVDADGIAQPDENGHIPGWVPVDPQGRQHCWHASTVDLDVGLGIVLEHPPDSNAELQLTVKHLRDVEGATMELIGTNINANPYKLGSKQQPIHMLVRHGSIGLNCAPPLDMDSMKQWFTQERNGVEGVVWHCPNGKLFKVHRHHLGLRWPVETARINTMPLQVNVDPALREDLTQPLFTFLAHLHGQSFKSLSDLPQSKEGF